MMNGKRKTILCIVGALLAVLLIAGVGIWAWKSQEEPEPSAADEVMTLIREKDYVWAMNVCNMQVKPNKNEAQKLERQMQAQISALDGEYRGGGRSLTDYTEQCRRMLNIFRTDALENQIKTQLTALTDEAYAQYMRVKDTDDGSAYKKAEEIFRVVLDAELEMTFDDASDKLSYMNTMEMSRQCYEQGRTQEEKQTYDAYIEALEQYRQVHKDSPRYSDAQTAITRCSNAFREMTLHILEVHYSNPDIYSYQSGLIWGLERIEDDLKVLPGDAVLTAKYTEWKKLLDADLRSEVDKTMADKSIRYKVKWEKVKLALQYLPDDEKLLAIKASLVEPMKQEFYKELRWRMGDRELSYCDRISGLKQELPDDPEVQQLYDAAVRYQWRGLHTFLSKAQNIQFLYYPRRFIDESTGEHLFRNDPIADAHGVLHDPFNLYCVTASVGNPASFECTEWNKGDGLKQLSFTVDAMGGSGSGTAVVEVYAYGEATYEGAPMTKIYTSPLLSRSTKNLKIAVDLNGVSKIEVRVVAKSGSVTLLWDHAYLDHEVPVF